MVYLAIPTFKASAKQVAKVLLGSSIIELNAGYDGYDGYDGRIIWY